MERITTAHGPLRPVLAALLALALLPLSACGPAGGGSGGLIQVVTSIGQWSSLALELGGDKVQVHAVINNPNADAHDYEPTTKDIAAISGADLVVVNGADYDTWAGKAARDNGRRVVDVAASSGKRSGDNPHLWFSSQAREHAAQVIMQAYKELRPGDKGHFERSYKLWHEREQRLEGRIAAASKKIGGGSYAATESAADYLAYDLGLNDLTPIGYLRATSNESEPSPADIHDFQVLIGSGRLKLLIYNDQEDTEVSRGLVAAADKAELPVVKVSEQMPAQYSRLEDWIGDLADSFGRALG
ncbi:hypothetical protein AB656_03860 [Bifidobacterium actinocoloniiforme DSM 22766]|nr:hypothetical protein AB656_03860 [Bifidobacterium actinocoloniiforme DSM 22766]